MGKIAQFYHSISQQTCHLLVKLRMKKKRDCSQICDYRFLLIITNQSTNIEYHRVLSISQLCFQWAILIDYLHPVWKRYWSLGVIVWESVPEVENVGRLILIKLAPEVGGSEIFQKPSWFCSLTLSSKVLGGPIWGLQNMENHGFERVSLDHHKNKQIKPFH